MHEHDDLWRGEMTSELRHLASTMGDVQRQLGEMHTMLAQELAAHREYHEQNEHRWGFARWCQLHPFRLVMLCAAGSALLAARAHVPAFATVVRLIADLLR